MPCQFKITPKAKQDIRGLPNRDVSREVQAWVARIAANPAAVSGMLTHGVRIMDGMALLAGESYYIQVQFSYIPGGSVCVLLALQR